MFECLELVKILKNPEDYCTLRSCQQRPSAWNPKKNQTHGCLRICHHHSGRIVLVRVRCTCFLWNTCSTFWTFEHLVIFGLLHWLHMFTWCTWWDWWENWEFMAGMKQEMQVGRVSKHSKYLMHSVSHSYLYLNKMWKFQPDQRCQPTMTTRTWTLGLVCPIVWVWVI